MTHSAPRPTAVSRLKHISPRRVSADTAGLLPDLPPLLRRIYLARDIRSSDDLQTGLDGLLPLTGLAGIDPAVHKLMQALQQQLKIVVVGDYDADGATASALALRALRSFGAQRVEYLVPDRFTYGYGLSPELADVAAGRGADLLLTVDNGISSVSGVARAGQLGMGVTVTDHHLPGEELPAAAAIVNPNQPGDSFPSKHAAGVGVVFYLLSALRGRLRESGWFVRNGIPEPNMADLLDLVAVGSVADLVRLDRNNRILVQQGLRRIRAGRCCPGISALLQLSGRVRERVTAADLGFAVGPRLNAAGRLDDMGLGIECLLSDDPAAALEYARTLDGLNRQRREIESEMKAQAEESMALLTLSGEQLPLGLCLYDERWHQGVVGILASRIKERYHRPVVALAAADEVTVKGSARSIPGLHIRDVLAAVDSRHPGLLERFGGHAMAAGLSLARDRVEDFAGAFREEVERQLDGRPPRAEILSDGELAPQEFDAETARLLRYAGPWGQGFPEPLFDGEFEVLSHRFVGDIHLKLLLSLDGAVQLDAIAFRWGDRPPPGERVRIAYRLDLNEYRGVESPQLIIEHLEPA